MMSDGHSGAVLYGPLLWSLRHFIVIIAPFLGLVCAIRGIRAGDSVRARLGVVLHTPVVLLIVYVVLAALATF